MKTRSFMQAVDRDRITAAIREAESRSHGEIRVHVESQPVEDAQKAAATKFESLGMAATEARNGVLIYVAPVSQTFAVIGDQAIHERCGQSFWADVAAAMEEDFRAGRFTDGLVKGIARTGDALAVHFPRTGAAADKNELADDVSEG
jgi:uncharacterized membrane protein